MSKTAKKFYFLVAAQIIFVIPDPEGKDDPNMSTAFINGVVTNDRDLFPSHLVGKAQQVAQMQFFKRLGDEAPKVQVIDVVIVNINNLGYMTEEEFTAAPAGMVKQEKKEEPKLTIVGSGADVLDPAAIAAAANTLQ
jgi:hypothetical protein